MDCLVTFYLTNSNLFLLAKVTKFDHFIVFSGFAQSDSFQRGWFPAWRKRESGRRTLSQQQQLHPQLRQSDDVSQHIGHGRRFPAETGNFLAHFLSHLHIIAVQHKDFHLRHFKTTTMLKKMFKVIYILNIGCCPCKNFEHTMLCSKVLNKTYVATNLVLYARQMNYLLWSKSHSSLLNLKHYFQIFRLNLL